MLVVALVVESPATVTQVDGTILPVPNGSTDCDGAGGDNLQTCFNTLEGVSPPNAQAIHQTLDAATVPEIFLPNTGQAVVFRDVSEGAGFENSFGWYNVGDDVATAGGRAANLHPILGCGRPMVNGPGNATTHSGEPTFYLQSAEPNQQISVNFATERAAGRYKGGFIAFYLITPEGNPSADNCGDFKNGSDGNSLFGRIYYTQKDLNNDGDFVHHLVYQSKRTPNRFYFGFEDLFRGGDNDFEDMLIQVTGLTPPCTPQTEVCDGIDNDCDGAVDSDDPDLTGVDEACLCDGASMTCDNGPRFGQCRTGVTVCRAGEIQCHGTGQSSPEVCDNLDNNCNNQIDDNPSGTGAACDGQDADTCPEGAIVCQSGALVCNDVSANNVEVCNNVDDDCDGTIDEGNPGGGGSCGSSVGVCSPGTLVCQSGTLVCQGGNSGGPETCDGEDDDCNGVVDDNPAGTGVSCGASDAGECSFGETICVNGTLSCAGEVGPSPERCNTLDDDCDTNVDESPVDAGQPCGSSIGRCEPGRFACAMNGTLVCVGGVGPTVETCNAIDDDCDGKIDEEVPGVGDTCGGGTGPCGEGTMRCIEGQMQCVGGTSSGTETCNDIDDDCDGTIDEGDLCDGGVCDNGVCASRCLPGEFPCPTGLRCVDDFCVADPCFNVQCPPDGSGNAQTCHEGACVLACTRVTCPTNLVCRDSDGACVPDRCEYLPRCQADELCVNGACVVDRCAGVDCPDEQFCRDGQCIASCQGVNCGPAQQCVDGQCAPTGCPVDCGDREVCNPTTGQCQDDPCQFVQCPPTQACNPADGQCIPDPCQGVTCPGNQVCSLGQCGVGTQGQLITTGGGGGCDATGEEPGTLVAGLVVALALVLRRRRMLLVVACAATLATGCKVNEYCLGCELDDAGAGDGDGGGDGGSGNGDGGGGCDPGNVRPETCNNADDDCDGIVDESIDFQGDENNCGACGVSCNKPGAQTMCSSGSCVITGCFPGFNDENGDTAGPYAMSDGCEYQCFTSNGGTEACDGLDNDCDGTVDEGFNTVDDVNNCGACGRVCEFFQADPHCVASQCVFDPATDCEPGFHDSNANQADGCEYQCMPSNGGVEACDVVDNDCDGQVDEDFDFSSDAANCGRCGLQCQFANATASCTNGTCAFDPATDCVPGYVDADGNQVDGCEYQCTASNMGVERCDAVDNDCNGIADDNTNDTGGACASTGTPRGACVADGTRTCASGQLVCTGATEPVAETCDNVDNDCDGMVDDAVTQSCYTGMPASTNGIGVCRGGTRTCSAGVFGPCSGEITPTSEQCNNLDDNCDGAVDNAPNGGPIVETCYGGLPGTEGKGTCRAGSRTCTFGSFGTCEGEVQPRTDVCGDDLDTDCDDRNDAAEGCLAAETEQRIDETTPNAEHSYDVQLARGAGNAIYATWSQRVGGATEVFLRKSTNGGVSWSPIVNVTASVTQTAVVPRIAVAPGATTAADRVVVAYQTVSSGVRDIRVSTSSDGGATFAAAVGPLDASGDSFHHALAVLGNRVVVTWEKLDTGTLIRDVQSAVSTNGGATFGAEFRVNVGSPATRFAGRPQVAITSTNGAVWVWREQRSGATRDVFAAASATLAAPTSDVRLDADTTQRRESDFPVIAAAGAAVYVAWQDVSTTPGGGADVMFVRTTDGGSSWSAERVIDDPAAEVSSSFTPAIAVDRLGAGSADDLVAIAWEDRRQGAQIFAAISRDGGATFGVPLRASSDAGRVAAGASSAPVIAAAGNGVLVIAYQNQVTNQNVHVFASSSIDGGSTWHVQQEQIDSGGGNALLPAIVSTTIGTDPGAVIAWSDFRGNQINGDIYTAVTY